MKVAFRVEGDGPRPAPLTVTVRVVPFGLPADAPQPPVRTLTLEQSGFDDDEDSVSVPIQRPPTVDAIEASSREAALAELAKTHTTQNGTGTWRVIFTVSDATGGNLIAGVETVRLRVSAETTSYFADAQIKAPEINR